MKQRLLELTPLKGCIGLVAGFWLAGATAQPTSPSAAFDHSAARESASVNRIESSAGDVDGDGVPDLLVGVPEQTVGGNAEQGRAFVSGGAGGLPLRTIDDPAPQPHARFGHSVASAGDVNGDGVSDLLVGAPQQTVGGNADQGQAFVFSGADGTLLHTLDDPIPQASARFGHVVASVKDENGDGIPEFLVAAPPHDEDPGQAFVFSGADGRFLHAIADPANAGGLDLLNVSGKD